MSEFREPDFSRGELELRFENSVVCIYGTSRGLKELADLCRELVENPEQGHIHLEHSARLTRESVRGAIAIFEKNAKKLCTRRFFKKPVRSK
jgi:hypothetical protein